MKHTIILSVFPGCGKTYLTENFNEKPFTMVDMSNVHWYYHLASKQLPKYYFDALRKNIGNVDVIFVSIAPSIRETLIENNIKYFTVVPSLDMKDDIIKRISDSNKKYRGTKYCNFYSKNYEWIIKEVIKENKLISEQTPAGSGGLKHTPFHIHQLTKDNPFLTNDDIYYLLDNSMGNLSSLWWNWETSKNIKRTVLSADSINALIRYADNRKYKEKISVDFIFERMGNMIPGRKLDFTHIIKDLKDLAERYNASIDINTNRDKIEVDKTLSEEGKQLLVIVLM